MGKLAWGIGATLATASMALLLFATPKIAHAMRAVDREISCSTYSGGAITIDDVTWIYSPYTECTETYVGGGGGGYTYYDPAPAGGGGGGGSGLFKAPNRTNNPTSATCKSDGETRYYHAAYDFAGWKASHAPLQLTGKGEMIQITYDDGGVELYDWIPGGLADSTVPPEAYLARIPNTLRCPS